VGARLLSVLTEARYPARPTRREESCPKFCLFFHVTPAEGEALRAALLDLRDTPGYRPGDYGMAIAMIHEARFVFVDVRLQAPAGVQDEDLGQLRRGVGVGDAQHQVATLGAWCCGWRRRIDARPGCTAGCTFQQ
jgi:hypothetical protein